MVAATRFESTTENTAQLGKSRCCIWFPIMSLRGIPTRGRMPCCKIPPELPPTTLDTFASAAHYSSLADEHLPSLPATVRLTSLREGIRIERDKAVERHAINKATDVDRENVRVMAYTCMHDKQSCIDTCSSLPTYEYDTYLFLYVFRYGSFVKRRQKQE